MRELHINKRDIRDTRFVDVELAPLAAGDARLKLDLFALTSNNITYAAMGEGAFGYWDFFPGPEAWGKVPVWGFATVIASNAPDIAVGSRYYGYYPLAETLDVSPRKTATGFIDTAPHRAVKAKLYNIYTESGADTAYDANYEPEQTLFRPLYGTGWWAADSVRHAQARTVVLSSASSKTALATAHQLRNLSSIEVVGLTSPANSDYVRESGVYHRTALYDEAGSLAVQTPVTFVDFLGRPELTGTIHRTLGSKLTRSIIIGVTDWAAARAAPGEPLPGPKPEFFFMPTYAAERLKADPQLGPAMVRDVRNFYLASHAFVDVKRVTGSDAIHAAWTRLVAGEVPPRNGLALSF